MALNKKGQSILVGLMVFFFVFITAVVLIPPLKEIIVDARSSAFLDCAATNLSTGVAATCLIIDLYLPYFIGVVLASASTLIYFKSNR